jgi:hypothetical protein
MRKKEKLLGTQAGSRKVEDSHEKDTTGSLFINGHFWTPEALKRRSLPATMGSERLFKDIYQNIPE